MDITQALKEEFEKDYKGDHKPFSIVLSVDGQYIKADVIQGEHSKEHFIGDRHQYLLGKVVEYHKTLK